VVTFPFLNPIFQPSRWTIASISTTNPMVVTTVQNNLFITGLYCRLYIPIGFGMPQANLLEAQITVTGPTTFTMPIDATAFWPFVIPPMNPGHFYTPAQVVSTGENTLMLTGTFRNTQCRLSWM